MGLFDIFRSDEPQQCCCSFCGKPSTEVKKLIAGPHGVYICDGCTEVCTGIIKEDVYSPKSGPFRVTGKEVVCNHCNEREFELIPSPFYANNPRAELKGEDAISILSCKNCGRIEFFRGEHKPKENYNSDQKS